MRSRPSRTVPYRRRWPEPRYTLRLRCSESGRADHARDDRSRLPDVRVRWDRGVRGDPGRISGWPGGVRGECRRVPCPAGCGRGGACPEGHLRLRQAGPPPSASDRPRTRRGGARAVARPAACASDALRVRITNADREGRYRIVKEVIGDPHQPCILIRTRLEGDEQLLARLRLFALLAPHLDVGGWDNSGYVAEAAGRGILMAQKHGTWLAMGATVPFVRRSCGYVGATDGWTDLAQD